MLIDNNIEDGIDFFHMDAPASVTIPGRSVVVRFQKRARNPSLVAAGFDTTDVAVPWWGGNRLRLVFAQPRAGTGRARGVESRTNLLASQGQPRLRWKPLAGPRAERCPISEVRSRPFLGPSWTRRHFHGPRRCSS
jgi:hypothetical protein